MTAPLPLEAGLTDGIKAFTPPAGNGSHEKSAKADWDVEKASNSTRPGQVQGPNYDKTLKDRHLHFYSTKLIVSRLGRLSVDLITKSGKSKEIPNHDWLHVQDKSISFEQFQSKCMNMTLDAEYKELIRELLLEVQKTNEKSFVQGRYLRPNAVITHTKRGGKKNSRFLKRVTFLAVPFFSMQPLRRPYSDKHYSGFPVRSLLQSVYSLETTTQRDLSQISSRRRDNESVIHVPEFWALTIGQRTLVTRSPFDIQTYSGGFIRQVPFRKALHAADKASLSVVHLTDKENNMFYIPVQECQTFYEFVSHVLIRCLQIRSADVDTLSLIDESQNVVDEYSWLPLLLRYKDSPLIRVRLKEEPKDGRIDTDRWRDNESSDSSSDASRPSVHGGSSYRSYRGRGDQDLEFVSTVAEELKDAYQALDDAKRTIDHETAYALEYRQIPEIEDRFTTMLDGMLATKLYQKLSEQTYLEKSVRNERLEITGTFFEQAKKITRQMPTTFASPLIDPQVRRNGRISEAGSLVKAPVTVGSSSSESDPSGSEKEYDREEIWFKKPRRVRNFGRRDPAMQYIPSKAAVRSALDDLNARRKPTTFSDIQVIEETLKTGKKLLGDVGYVESLRQNLHEVFVDQRAPLSLFQWPTKWSLGPEFDVDEAGRSVQRAFDRFDMLTTGLDGANARSSAIIAILLHDIDRECSPTNCSAITGLGIKISYKRAEMRTESEIEDLLDTLERTSPGPISTPWRQNDSRNPLDTLLDCQVALYRIAQVLVRAFVPQTAVGGTVLNKLWGSVYRIIANVKEAQGILDILPASIKIAKAIRRFQKGCVDCNNEIPPGYVLPQAIPVAFKSLVYYFISCSSAIIHFTEAGALDGTSSKSDSITKVSVYAQVYINYRLCRIAIRESKQQVVSLLDDAQKNAEPSVYDLASGEDLSTLVLSELQNQLVTEQGDFLLSELYTEHAKKLQYDVTRSASVQAYDEINRFREEIAAILATLNQQDDTLRQLSRVLFRPKSKYEYGADRDTIRHRTVEKLRKQIDERIDAFRELSKQADRIQMTAAQSISLKSEANNRAIVIFTIVTIVFLPLSFVTSFFGMNTDDIRDIDRSQWIFWSSAAPLTIVVVLAALITGYWERLQRWLGLVKTEKLD